MSDEELPSKPFLGVRFVLFGFHPADERKVRSKLIDGGAAEDSQYSRSSTHVIIDKIVWDDPVCVAARNDGKTLVTGLWVDHSYDIGMPVDASSIMYRPLRGLKGIPGANNLIVCLTGYQRQDRDDIMTMVGLMGAKFSKPLVANRVTHLICYKFEGEKYELAKKQKKIKIVNHRWLEDCLRDWELVPEDDYSKCGYELEMLEAEAEAKDSEDEAEETSKRSGSKSIQKSPHGSKAGTATVGEMSKVAPEVSNASEPVKLSNAKGKGILLSSSKLEGPYLESSFDGVAVPQDGSNKDADYIELPVQNENSPHSVSDKDNVLLDTKFSAKSYSRKSQGQSPENCQMSVLSGKTSLNVNGSAEGTILQEGSSAPSPNVLGSKDLLGFSFTESDQTEVPSGGSSFKGKGLHDEDVSPGLLPQKRMMDSVSSKKSQKMSRNLKAAVMASPVFGYGNPGLKNDLTSFMTESSRVDLNEDADENSALSYSKGLKESTPCKLDPINSSLKNDLAPAVAESPKNVQNNTTDQRSPDKCLRVLTESTAASKLNLGKSSGAIKAGSAGKAGEMQIQHFDVTSTGGKSPTETSHSPPNRKLLDGGCSRLAENPSAQKTFGRRNLGSFAKRKDSTFSENIAYPDNNITSLSRSEKVTSEGAICSGDDVKRLTHDSFSKLEMSPKTSSESGTEEEVMAQHGTISLEGGVDKTVFNDDETESRDEKPEDGHLKTYDSHKFGLPEVAHKPDSVETNHVIGDLNGRYNMLADKPFAKKTLGRRPNLSSHAKKNNSTCSDKVTSPDSAVCKSGKSKKMTSKGAFGSDNDGQELTHGNFSKLKFSSQTISNVVKEKEIAGQVNISINDGGDKAGFPDTETESPNEHPEDAYLNTYGGKPNLSATVHKVDNQQMNHATCGSDVNIIDAGNAGDMKSKKVMSSSKESTMKGMGGKMKKQVLRKPKTKTAHVALKRNGDKVANGSRKFEEEGNGKENMVPDVEKNDNNSSISKSFGSMKVEKKPVEIDQDLNLSETVAGMTEELKPNGKSSKSTKRSNKANSYLVPAKAVASRAKAEPSCFIVSGHRLQRKEFQKVIRDLKGRCCRDSHQWSYQATHFIAPDPIRRTEKFFAAAASGRWILKTDYLSACSKEGKFLPEQPYEWHKNGLSEDGAINLEAPRKWRLLREKTGHGALYGMRIIIYGECIAPPLETLKRVVKAGDGTILATSPPYTKFLKSGVDFAIVSPGMPHVDLWVQEFLKHEIPCVSADYLVEYVCKPGYPLEKHVLHNTNAWAEKSFADLTRRSEAVVEVANPVKDCGSDDISCQVCGFHDRGDVMLICGDESGFTGCGIGVHTDCCDPPLPDVPSGDWFCSNCSTSRKSPAPLKKRKAGQSSRKYK